MLPAVTVYRHEKTHFVVSKEERCVADYLTMDKSKSRTSILNPRRPRIHNYRSVMSPSMYLKALSYKSQYVPLTAFIFVQTVSLKLKEAFL